MDVLQECADFVKSLHEKHRRNYKKGDGILCMFGYPDYDYLSTDVDQIDKMVESFDEWVVLCRDIDSGAIKKKDVLNLWGNSPFPILIFKSVLVLEYYQTNIDIDCGVIMSGVLDEIEMESWMVSNYSLYLDIFGLVYICWLPVNRPDLFTIEVVNKLENLLLRIGLMLANKVGKNRRDRFCLAKAARKRGLKAKVRDKGNKKPDIVNACKFLAEKGVADRDIASKVAKRFRVSVGYVRQIRAKIKRGDI